MPDTTDTTTSLPPPEAKAESDLLDILIDTTAHHGRHAGSPLRRIASGRVEKRLREWKDQLLPHITAAG